MFDNYADKIKSILTENGDSMKKSISLILVFIMLFGIMSFNISAKEADNVAYRVYVSVSGNDSTADGSSSKPFETIGKAKEFVKTLDKSNGDIVVEIGDGTYFLSEEVVFDENDSGTANCTIRYVAAKGANPVFSGGKKVEGEWTDEGGNIFSIPYDRDEKLRALYIDGQRAYMTSRMAV